MNYTTRRVAASIFTGFTTRHENRTNYYDCLGSNGLKFIDGEPNTSRYAYCLKGRTGEALCYICDAEQTSGLSLATVVYLEVRPFKLKYPFCSKTIKIHLDDDVSNIADIVRMEIANLQFAVQMARKEAKAFTEWMLNPVDTEESNQSSTTTTTPLTSMHYEVAGGDCDKVTALAKFFTDDLGCDTRPDKDSLCPVGIKRLADTFNYFMKVGLPDVQNVLQFDENDVESAIKKVADEPDGNALWDYTGPKEGAIVVPDTVIPILLAKELHEEDDGKLK